MEPGFALKIGLNAISPVELASASGKSSVRQSDGNEVTLGAANAGNQKFILTDLAPLHRLDPGIRGVLGQWFLTRFDYSLNLKTKCLEFGKQPVTGTRTGFTMVNLRLVVPTSLGDLVLDSGAGRLVLFGVESNGAVQGRLQTLNGTGTVRSVSRKLTIGERKIWQGDALTMASPTEPGVAGLLPLNLFESIYVSNSEGYVVFN